MIRKILFLLIIPCAIFAQDTDQKTDTKQNVELPEFVITGVERVSLPTVSKPKADLVPTLSTGFFKPVYSNEELPLAELSNPVKKEITFVNQAAQLNGRLILGAGIYTLPTGEFSYGKGFDNGVFNGRIFGFNERPYQDYSGLNSSGTEVKTSFFNSYNSGFLPGTKFTVGGNYFRDSYKFFASPTPDLQRDLFKGNVSLGLENLLKQNLKYGASLNERMLYVKDADESENTFTGKGFLEAGFDGFTIGINGHYENQNLRRIASRYYDFREGNVFVRLEPSDALKFTVGLYYGSTEKEDVLYPTGSVKMKFTDQLSFNGEIAPYTEFTTVADYIYINRYLNTNSITNILTRNRYNLKLALKYEYGTYFEIDGGFRFIDYGNLPYFSESDSLKGRFDINTTSAKSFLGFVNFLFHPGPFGVFYGDVQMENLYDSHNNRVPYNAALRSNLSYAYDFPFGLKTESKLTFASGVYTDIPKANKPELVQLNPYFDLSLRLAYDISGGFNLFTQFSNIFNHNNYLWYGYKEKPFDVVFGLDYRF